MDPRSVQAIVLISSPKSHKEGQLCTQIHNSFFPFTKLGTISKEIQNLGQTVTP